MIRDITIGQYYPVESVIHRLDPRTKLAISFLYIISLFLANNKYMYLLALAALVVYIGCSKVPLKFMLKGLKGIAIFILFSVVLNMFFTKGDPFLDHFPCAGSCGDHVYNDTNQADRWSGTGIFLAETVSCAGA